jgi:ribonuclease HI
MKKLKLDHTLAEHILEGAINSTWRLFDDKDLAVNDHVLLVDKVKPDDPTTWKDIGVATIDNIVQKRIGDINENDMNEHEGFATKENILKTCQRYYGSVVTLQTPIKVVYFTFSRDIPDQTADILPSAERVVIYTDGGSRGNPGPSASGFVIFDDQKKLLVSKGVYLGITTNNQAEYTALKLALEEVKNLGAREVTVYMDSLLVVNQMKGIYKVKNRDLWPIHDAIKQLSSQFEHISFTQVPRELNKLADAEVNKALDEKLVDGSYSEPGS